ncbi:serine/threonine-protein kinase [Umezawaea endophytica]|uniref:non-specific serine/threonine protein kinase n=1 Tax=Umezawaea endophytica TaxID=1654476 RepID=A0A9X2VPW9_9PSEU|nr:serine/threonine-protein kinase [Umezawaea endophytica]MCS7480530.1 serine/threonine protein kinase [Umezawaea endophytica]
MIVILDQADLLAGRYRLLDRIGSGGMGVVWAAEDRLLRRQVAIKEVHPDHEDRMRREAQVGAKVCHPNVVTVYDLVYEGDKPWLVMRLVRSRSLAAVLVDDGPMRPSQAAAMGRQLLAGLDAVHAQGVVHCDVKPGNVLLDDRDDAYLTDFGIAADTGSRMIGTLFGAPSYIAPERARGLPMGPASDLWSLGATLYAAVEGRPPLDRGDPLSTVTAIVSEQPEPPAHAGGLRSVIDGLLERDPADRPEAAEVARLLRQVSDTAGESTLVRPPVVALGDRSASIPIPRRVPELSLPRHRAVGMGKASTSTPRHSAATTPEPDTESSAQGVLPVPAPRDNPTTAIPVGRPPLLHRTPLVLLGLTAGIAAGLVWFGGQAVQQQHPAGSPTTPTSQAPAVAPEAAVQPSGGPTAKPVAQAPAQAPARAPEALSSPADVPDTTAPVVTSTEAQPETTTPPAPTTTEAPSSAPETTEAESSTPPPNGPSEVEPLG